MPPRMASLPALPLEQLERSIHLRQSMDILFVSLQVFATRNIEYYANASVLACWHLLTAMISESSFKESNL